MATTGTLEARLNAAVQEQRSKGMVCEYVRALDFIPKIAACVELDRERLSHEVEEALWQDSANAMGLLSGILKKFGLSLIRDKKIERVLCRPDRSNLSTENILTIDETRFAAALGEFAALLGKYEQEHNEMRSNFAARNDQMVARIEAAEEELKKKQADEDSVIAAIVGMIQRKLTVPEGHGVDPEQEDEMQQLADLYQMKICWSCEEQNLPYSSMFAELMVEEKALCKKSPCIMRKGKVLAKGRVYRVKSVSEKGESDL